MPAAPLSLPNIDHDAVVALIREAAETLILPRFNALDRADIQEKGPGDLVTVADIEAEHFLTPRLSDLLPSSLVVGEEAHAKTPEILSRFEEDAPVWLIDPVDGTKNFAEASPTFCTMVALTLGNQTIMGWIHDALKNETTCAELGAGAWRIGPEGSREGSATDDSKHPGKGDSKGDSRGNGYSRITVPAPPEDEKRWVGQLDRWSFEKPRGGQIHAAASARFGELSSLSCAGQDYLAQVEGRRQFALYRRLWPWDHAPGVLILREAGGMADRIDGTPYRAGDRVHGLLSAPSEPHWHDLRRLMTPR